MSMVLAAVKNGIIIGSGAVLENRDAVFSFIDGNRITVQIEEYPQWILEQKTGTTLLNVCVLSAASQSQNC